MVLTLSFLVVLVVIALLSMWVIMAGVRGEGAAPVAPPRAWLVARGEMSIGRLIPPWAIALAVGWFSAIIFGSLGLALLPLKDDVRRVLDSQVCASGERIYVATHTGPSPKGGTETTTDYYCGKHEGHHAGGANLVMAICGLFGAIIPSGLGVLVATSLVRRRKGPSS
jgi:hypothetical protein